MPAGFQAPCRLLVYIPEEYRHHPFDVYLVQSDEDVQVGRVGWRLASKEWLGGRDEVIAGAQDTARRK